MLPQVAGFDWDTANTEKCRSHGVSTGDIEALFGRPVAVFPAPDRSMSEIRYKAIGANADGRYIFLVFTLRKRGGEMLIRPISARFMHAKEIRHYEEEAAKAQKR